MGLAGASESHWAAGYNSSYAAASYAAASSFAYGGSSAAGANSGELSAGQQAGQDTPSAANSQLPTGKKLRSFENCGQKVLPDLKMPLCVFGLEKSKSLIW